MNTRLSSKSPSRRQPRNMAASTRALPTFAGAAAAAVLATLWTGLPAHAQAPAAPTTPVAAAPAAPAAPATPAVPLVSPSTPTAAPAGALPSAATARPAAAPAAPSPTGAMSSPITVKTPLIAPDDNYLSRLAELQRDITLQEKERELRELQVKVEQLEYDRLDAINKTRDLKGGIRVESAPRSDSGTGGLLGGLLSGLGNSGASAQAPSAPTTTGPTSALPMPGADQPVAPPAPLVIPPMPEFPTASAPTPSAPRATANVSAVRGVGESMTADLILEDGSVVTVKSGDRVPGVGTISRISAEGVYVGGGKRGGGRRLSFGNNIPSSGGGMGDMPGLPMPPMNIPYTPTSMPTMPNLTLPGAGQIAGQPQLPPGGQMVDGPLSP